MRIRRNASKLLGSASAAAYSIPSPATAGTAAADPEEEFTVCELNRSPWDVMDINLCNFFTSPKEEKNGGILGNFFKTEVEEPITAVASTAAELTLKEMKEIENKKIKRRKVCKGTETVLVAETETATYCKKSDGKGWHCKRLAQLPSSLCSYHLAQIRSYSSNHSHRAADASAVGNGNGNGNGNGKNLQAKPAAVGETGVAANFYYYYNGFGPWRSKRRCKGGVNATCVKVMDDTKEGIDRKESVNHDDDDHVVAGDDEYDLDCFGEEGDDDDDNDNLYCMPRQNEDNGRKKEGETEKKKVLKKRGRKPFKCRSLKSLL